MQDRYVGDIGDFVKLAILRALTPGRQPGVIWWRYPDEDHNRDGRHVTYLDRPEKWRARDPELFDGMHEIVSRGERRIQALEVRQFLSSATYCAHPLPTDGPPSSRRANRLAWFERVSSDVADCDFVFADPDNGLEPTNFEPGAKGSGKSIALDEIAALAKPSRSLLIYHHQTRRAGGHLAEIEYWAERLSSMGLGRVDAIRARPYSPRVFFLINGSEEMRANGAAMTSLWKGDLTWHGDVG
jgi:hypothetical protein